MRFICLLHILLILGCNTSTTTAQSYRSKIISFAEFEKLQGAPLTENYDNIKSVKIVYALKNKQLYFINSKIYRLHFDFCKSVLNDKTDHYTYNEINYSNTSKRQYLLANLNYYQDQELFNVELSPGDNMSYQQLEFLYNVIKENLYAGDQLKLFINTPFLTDLCKTNSSDLPQVSANEIFEGQKLQVIYENEAFGELLMVDAYDLEEGKVADKYDKILLIKGSSNYVPVAAGIITTDFQTPLSHISILAQNRKTPVVTYKNAWDNEYINSLNGKYVKFTVTKDTFLITPYDKSLVKDERKNLPVKKLKIDQTAKGLYDMKDVTYRDHDKVGSKAANFSELLRVKNVKGKWISTPEGAFAIPVYYYLAHINKNGIKPLIDNLWKDTTLMHGDPFEGELEEIRRQIKKAPIDPKLLEMVKRKIIANNVGNRYRFRSSSNAEDLPGFNGAGLYDSKTGILDSTDKSIEKAIKKVWASLWNFRAFQERLYFNIDQRDVAMGILVHRSFPDEYANGVAITKNLYRDYQFGFVLNMQVGETSVVRPPEDVFCEQSISYLNRPSELYGETNAIQYLSYSNLNEYKAILTPKEMRALSYWLNQVKKHFYKQWRYSLNQMPYHEFALDIEFKYELNEKGQKILYIKQVRPFGN